MDPLDFEMEKRFGAAAGQRQPQQPMPQHGGMTPDQAIQARQMTPFGHPMFSANRPAPGQQSSMIDPQTGRPMDRATWMAIFMPEAFAASKLGQAQNQPMPAPSTMPMMPQQATGMPGKFGGG